MRCTALILFVMSSAFSLAAEAETAPEPPWVLCLEAAEYESYRCALVARNGKLLHPPSLAQVVPFASNGTGGFIAAARAVDGGWGYLDENSAWLVEPVLENARQHADNGLARFQRDGKWGFVDLLGKVVIRPSFDDVRPFMAGYAAVKQGEKWGYIEASGEVVIKPRFQRTGPFSTAGLAAAVKAGDSKFGYVDTSGKWAIKPRFEGALPFSDAGVAPASIENKRMLTDVAWGLIDSEGSWVVKPQYVDIEAFNEWDLAAVTIEHQKSYGSELHNGFIDTDGKVVMADRYLDESMACGLVRKTYGSARFFGSDGKPAFEKALDWADGFNANCAAVALDARSWGILHSDGRFVPFPASFREPLTTSEGWIFDFWGGRGLLPVLTEGGAAAFLDKEGVEHFRFEPRGVAGQDRLLDQQGKEIWKGASTSSLFAPLHSHLQEDAREHFADPNLLTGDITTVARRLLEEKPRNFYPNSLVFEGERNPYDLSELDEEPEEVVSRGAIEVLAQTYVHEGRWGRYLFLSEHLGGQFDDYLEAFTKKLTASFGEPLEEPPTAYLRWGDSNEQKVWKVGSRYVVLESHSESGDGDFAHQLWLAGIDAHPRARWE